MSVMGRDLAQRLLEDRGWRRVSVDGQEWLRLPMTGKWIRAHACGEFEQRRSKKDAERCATCGFPKDQHHAQQVGEEQ